MVIGALFLSASPVLAHPDHDINEEPDLTPEQTARASIVRLITQAKLPATWTKAELVSSKQRTVKGLRQTVLTFRNPTEKVAARQTLFVLLDNKYQFLSADHVLK